MTAGTPTTSRNLPRRTRSGCGTCGIVGAFESRSTVEVYRRGLLSGKIWQRNFSNRVVGDERELTPLRQNIQENPKVEALVDGMLEKFQQELEEDDGGDA